MDMEDGFQMSKTVRIFVLGPDTTYVDDIVAVFHEAGKSFIDEQVVLRYLTYGVVLMAYNNAVLGGLLAFPWQPVETEEWRRIIPSLRSDPAAFAAHQMAVKPDYENRGIGTRLMLSALDEVQVPYTREPFQRWLVISRVPRDGGKSSYNLLSRLRFKELGRDPFLYADDGGCPVCGNGSCRCIGVLMEWRNVT